MYDFKILKSELFSIYVDKNNLQLSDKKQIIFLYIKNKYRLPENQNLFLQLKNKLNSTFFNRVEEFIKFAKKTKLSINRLKERYKNWLSQDFEFSYDEANDLFTKKIGKFIRFLDKL